VPEPPAKVEKNSLRTRLHHPLHTLPADDFAATWFDQTVWLRVPGHAALAADVAFLNHLRRSFGGALGAGASPEASAGHPCPWRSSSALDHPL